MINNYQLNVNNLMLTALGNIQATPESKFFSVNFKSDVRFENDTDKIAFYPNFAEIMIEDTNNIKNKKQSKKISPAEPDTAIVTCIPKQVGAARRVRAPFFRQKPGGLQSAAGD